jgi:hypothetical protein
MARRKKPPTKFPDVWNSSTGRAAEDLAWRLKEMPDDALLFAASWVLTHVKLSLVNRELFLKTAGLRFSITAANLPAVERLHCEIDPDEVLSRILKCGKCGKPIIPMPNPDDPRLPTQADIDAICGDGEKGGSGTNEAK